MVDFKRVVLEIIMPTFCVNMLHGFSKFRNIPFFFNPNFRCYSHGDFFLKDKFIKDAEITDKFSNVEGGVGWRCPRKFQFHQYRFFPDRGIDGVSLLNMLRLVLNFAQSCFSAHCFDSENITKDANRNDVAMSHA